MKNRIITFLPLFRDVPLAIAYSTIWCIVLWMVKYPADERIGVAVIAYITLWVSRAILSNLTVALLRALRNYGMKAAARVGIELPDQTQEESAPGVNLVVISFLLAVIATILGCSLVPITYIASALGLPQISLYFSFVGLVMLAVGMCALALFFLIPLMLFARTETLHKAKDLSAGISRIEESELIVQRRLGVQASLS
ncbi:MAG: hypothetical protein F4X34_06730 [Chloroflexi bacterium]|nr:hypothetical protein [Chloroflexota bacterium]